MSNPNKPNPNICNEGRPPVFKKWRSLYFIVLGNLILLIALFYFLTRHFA